MTPRITGQFGSAISQRPDFIILRKGEVDRIKEAMERDVQEGCQTFDLALLNLYRARRISAEEAVATPTAPPTCASR